MQDFTGIAEKLTRAEENIHNLYAEMEGFFQKSDYPVLPENDKELLFKAIEYHKNLVIPPRFSVLAGEVIHHLRSCFDHVVWHFSVGPVKHPRQVEFPVFDKLPVDKRDRERFGGKIQGITDPDARSLIERLQPYNTSDPTDDPLWLIHDFDIIDKHKELILCVGTGGIVLPREMKGILESYQRAHPELDSAQVARHFKGHGPSQPFVSFRNFGRRKIEPVTEGLIKLFDYTISAIKEFTAL
jgi:hypothetical protein